MNQGNLSWGERKYRDNKNSFESLVLGERYLVIQRIGGGEQGQIFKGIDIKNQKKVWVALKILFISKLRREQLDKKILAKKLSYISEEDRILRKFSHPNILRWYQTYSNQELKIIVTQYCNQGSLEDMINKHTAFQLNHAIHVLKQTIQALKVLHENQIIHRDLKPSNIFVHNGRYIIGDFGISKVFVSEDKEHTHCGSSYTQAPEVRTGKYSLNADIYSIGVLLYIMLCPNGTIPERGLEAQKMTFTENKRPKMKDGKQFPSEVMDFLQRSLEKNPQNRMNWIDLQGAPIFRLEDNEQLPNQLTQQIQIKEVLISLKQKQITFLQQNQELKNEESNSFEYVDIQEMEEQEFETNKIYYSSILTEEQDQKYTKAQQILIRCKIAEFIYKEIIRKIQQNQDFKLNLRNHRDWVSLMYKLSSTAFIYLSKSLSILSKQEQVSPQYGKFLGTKIERLYMKCKQEMQSYGKRLYHLEHGVLSFFRNQVEKVMDRESYTEKVLQLSGILEFDFGRKENINFILKSIGEIKSNKNLKDNQELLNIEKKVKVLHELEKIKTEDVKKKPISTIFREQLDKF